MIAKLPKTACTSIHGFFALIPDMVDFAICLSPSIRGNETPIQDILRAYEVFTRKSLQVHYLNEQPIQESVGVRFVALQDYPTQPDAKVARLFVGIQIFIGQFFFRTIATTVIGPDEVL
jgi:hypothetical protein